MLLTIPCIFRSLSPLFDLSAFLVIGLGISLLLLRLPVESINIHGPSHTALPYERERAGCGLCLQIWTCIRTRIDDNPRGE